MIEDEKDLLGLFYITIVIFAFALTGVSCLNSLYKKNTQKEPEPPLIVCSSCKGKGEKLTDVNKLMMDASLAIFFNHHLMVDKCEKCVKLPHGDGYDYCDVVNERYQTLLKEYGAAGPKMDMAACEQFMGEGTFSSKDLTTGKWLTQEEHDEKSKKN
jgi:hypothetical protein